MVPETGAGTTLLVSSLGLQNVGSSLIHDPAAMTVLALALVAVAVVVVAELKSGNDQK